MSHVIRIFMVIGSSRSQSEKGQGLQGLRVIYNKGNHFSTALEVFDNVMQVYQLCL